MNKKTAVEAKTKKKYKFLEHTADVEFIAYGKNFEEALINTGKATIEVMTDISKIKIKQKKQISIESKTKESLVYDFIEQLIFLIDTEGFLVSEIKKMKIKKEKAKLSLTAELKGDNAQNYDIHTQIKAATYNDMKITETKKECTIRVVLDI